MKILIIGAGWVGCHLGKKLMECGIDFVIFESDVVFSSTSYHNQNRLHLGFHYPRSHRTRNLCKKTFDYFLDEYGDFVNEVPINVYGVPEKSIIDFSTYIGILEHDKIQYGSIELRSLKGVEGTINTKEMCIDHRSIKIYFEKILSDKIQYKKIDSIDSISSNYDLVINCTNNFIKSKKNAAYYELSLSLVYRKIGVTDFDALTLVDGNFFSIYPYIDDLYTLTDVEYTPLICTDSSESIPEIKNSIKEDKIFEIRDKIVEKVLKIYPEFLDNFEYYKYFISTKSKTDNQSADRYPIISKEGNVVSCFTGKIQGIYVIEDYIKKIIKDLK